MQSLSDEQLQAKTIEFKDRISKGESLDSLLPEAFAVCREASSRVLGKKHFRVQLLGGMVLHQGRIAGRRTLPDRLFPRDRLGRRADGGAALHEGTAAAD